MSDLEAQKDFKHAFTIKDVLQENVDGFDDISDVVNDDDSLLLINNTWSNSEVEAMKRMLVTDSKHCKIFFCFLEI